MKIHRIWALILRYLYGFKYSLDRLTDVFYWPVLDLVLFGLTSRYFLNMNQGSQEKSTSLLFAVIIGILFWVVVTRSQYDIAMNFLSEIWNRNLINLFVSPLSIDEWIVSLLIMGLIKASLAFITAGIFAFVLYQIQILTLGLYLVPYVILLMVSGWWLGFFIVGLILQFGRRIEAFGWVFTAILAPFSAIYYPVSYLPEWGQVIARILPMSYIFEGAREVIIYHHFDINKVLISLAMNIILLTFSLWYLKRCFKKLLNRGLVSVH